jgi:hypothetical protein
MPGLLAVSASEGINLIRSTLSILENLQANVHAARSISSWDQYPLVEVGIGVTGHCQKI